ncbi:MAG TPA: isoprenylcysteine carboxylmethyltransferase family protein, partial [Stellaceae bacterium]|nr:isoprenylcysteine carboxylmethyltransferase family protein [Stellaceae bacterium]
GFATPLWGWIAAFVVLQGLHHWVIATLGKYWTTRIIVVPDAPLVASGPYRFMRHPNYAVVIAEIAVLPLAFREYAIAIVFSLLNAALLWWRVRLENRTLAARR